MSDYKGRHSLTKKTSQPQAYAAVTNYNQSQYRQQTGAICRNFLHQDKNKLGIDFEKYIMAYRNPLVIQ